MSGKLSCTAVNCVNNLSGLCSANTINVSGASAHSSVATNCETFAEKGLKNSISNVLNMNVVGEFKQVFNSESIEMSPSIRCEATRCVHNKNDLCVADNIMVNGVGTLNTGKTQCKTFKE